MAEEELKDGSVVIEGDGAGGSAEGGADNADERLNNGEGGSGGEDDDEHIDSALPDAEREAIRARRREERKQKKEQQREREESLRRELRAKDTQISQLSTRLDQVERRTQSADLGQVDEAIKQTASAYQYFKGQIEVAVKTGDGATVAEATEKMIAAQRKAEQLVALRDQAARGQQRPQALDPRLISLGSAWQAKRPWYNPAAADTDMDTRIALQVDDALTREGWQPTTQEYWDELDSRLKKYLPHRYNSEHNSNTAGQQGGRRSPVAGSGREGSGGGAGQQSFTLSPERVNAMKEAGLWSDPAKREKAIARYREHDRQVKQGEK